MVIPAGLAAADGARPTIVRWRIVAWIVVASIVAYVLRFNLSVAGPAMMRDLGLTEKQLGVILGAFAWTYGLFQIPGGFIGQRYGPRKTMTVVFLAWFATTALMAAIPRGLPIAISVALLVALRGAQGAAQAPVFPVTAGGSFFAWLPVGSWSFANGLSAAGTTIGAALAGPGVTWLVLTIGWRQSFFVCAPLGILLAALWWWDYRDDPEAHPATNDAEVALIKSDRDATHARVRTRWMHLLADRDLLCITLSYASMNYLFYLFFNWFFYYLTEVRHVPATLGGYFVGAQWMVGAVAAVLGGIACDRLCARYGARRGCRIAAVGGLVVAVPLLVGGTFVQQPVVSVALLSLSFGCTQFVDATYWAATTRMAGAEAQAATGMLNTGGNITGGIGAMLVPAIAASFGWATAVASGAVFAVVAAALWFGVRADVTMQSRRKTAGATT